MDSSLYKDFTTSHGHTYHYFFSPPKDNAKPYLLFLHGFPSTSFDWRHQVPFFLSEGYGLIVPDMLGFGGSSKPVDLADYRSTILTKDLVELVDGENATQVVAIGHDWGCKIISRLANYYPDRFVAFGLLAVGYFPPSTESNYEQFLDLSKKTFGYELFGYWSFFSSEGADKIIEDNMEPFLRLLYAHDPKLMISDFAPTGALKAYLLQGKTDVPLASYITEEEKDFHKKELLDGGMASCLNWYKIMTSEIDAEDNKAAPEKNLEVTKPVFYGGALKDFVALNAVNKAGTVAKCKNATIHEYEGCHWVMWEAKDAVNRDLLTWLKAL
ncbi:Alpha/Beta hydrolase protein [Desarmillaria tabescens]|uniref:Alpha/Beta hydrolase protein n=1 Tax=Armillaria tabescens TaxID=1929756 RepID=A0AA39JFD0_ARMTA|nr:Alpha/Beta hydrolase protein [Desarmillaria tabescens]KAK0441745.1 Alpha/Beta hydrolase protein [Desarmillaria tabescens]